MQLGLFTPVFNSLSFDALLTELKRYPEISTLELGTGGWPGGSHLNLDALLTSKSAAADFRLQGWETSYRDRIRSIPPFHSPRSTSNCHHAR